MYVRSFHTRIYNLSNIKHFVSILGNRIKCMSNLSGLRSLTELNMRRNRVESVHEIDTLPALERLFLSHNNIAWYVRVHVRIRRLLFLCICLLFWLSLFMYTAPFFFFALSFALPPSIHFFLITSLYLLSSSYPPLTFLLHSYPPSFTPTLLISIQFFKD